MKKILEVTVLASSILGSGSLGFPLTVQAQQSLSLVYPSENHQTTAAQIFFIGTASPQGEVLYQIRLRHIP